MTPSEPLAESLDINPEANTATAKPIGAKPFQVRTQRYILLLGLGFTGISHIPASIPAHSQNHCFPGPAVRLCLLCGGLMSIQEKFPSPAVLLAWNSLARILKLGIRDDLPCKSLSETIGVTVFLLKNQKSAQSCKEILEIR